jgi:hypothetical protein
MAINEKGFYEMKTRTKPPKKEVAACLPEQAAGKNHLQKETYGRATSMSRTNLKESVGTLLLYLQFPLTAEQQEKGLCLFEVLLTRYLEAKRLGGGK